MQITMTDIRKRQRYLSVNSPNYSKQHTFQESTQRAIDKGFMSEVTRLFTNGIKGISDSVSFSSLLELFDYIVENGTLSQVINFGNILCEEAIPKVRDAKEAQTNLRRKLGRAKGKINNRVSDNIDKAYSAVQGAINGAKGNFKKNTDQIKANVKSGLGKSDKDSEKKNEAAIEAYINMEQTASKMVQIDRILENYNKISKRFNIDRIIDENYHINGLNDCVVQICSLIETYEMPINVKFNTALEVCWYGFNKSAIPFNLSEMVTTCTDYFLAMGKNHNMCVNILENSLVVDKKEYNGDLEIITEEEPEEDDIVIESKLSSNDKKNLKNSDYGLPNKKKYPMPDADHVKAAIRMFNHVDRKDEEELARNIKRKAKEFNVELNVGLDNRLSKYLNDYEMESFASYAVRNIRTLTEAEDFNKILNDFKASDDEHKENKLQQLVRNLYAKSPNQVIDGTPNLLEYIRVIFILGGMMIHPALAAVMAIADIFLSLHKKKEETEYMRKAFKSEIDKTQKKIDTCKSSEVKNRLEKYKKTLEDAYNKIDEYYETLLTDEEIDKKYDEDHANDEDEDWDFGDDDSSNDDDDFGDFDDEDFDNLDEAVKYIDYTARLMSVRESIAVTNFGKSSLNTILSAAPYLVEELTDISSRFPEFIDPKILSESINDTLSNNSLHIGYIDKCALTGCYKSCLEYANRIFIKHRPNIFDEAKHLNSGNLILKALNELVNVCYYNTGVIEEASFSNSIKLASEKVKKALQKLSDKDRQISKNIDVAANNFQKAAEKSLTTDNRESVIKGTILPSASKCIKGAIVATGAAVLIDPVIAVIGALGWLGVSSKYKAKERQMVLDEIEIELKMCDKYIALAEDKNDMKALRRLYNIQRELERQRQRIKYKMKVKYGQKYYDADETLSRER